MRDHGEENCEFKATNYIYTEKEKFQMMKQKTKSIENKFNNSIGKVFSFIVMVDIWCAENEHFQVDIRLAITQ